MELESGDVYNEKQLSLLRQGLRGIAMNIDQSYPSLRNIVLHQWEARRGVYRSEYRAEVSKVLSTLYVLFPKTFL
jgi:hypothetical protein